MTPTHQRAHNVAQIAAGLSKAQREKLLVLSTYGHWLIASEVMPGAGSSLTLLCTHQTPPLVERRWVRWGGETGQCSGAGYEYRPTKTGLAVRAHLAALEPKP